MKKILIILNLMLVAMGACAQEFNMKRFELAGDQLLLYYDLLDTAKNRSYTVHVYSSRDNYLNPLQKLSGDVGLEVKPGMNKKITWNAKEELGAEFEGNVAIEVRGKLYIPFVRMSGFDDTQVRKRGVPFMMTWSGGTRQNVLNFDLYKGAEKVWTQAGVGNTGKYEMTIPKNVKPGEGYRFKISDSKNRDDVVYTGDFAIKRKVPLLLKMIPVVAVAGGAYFLLQSNETPDIGDAPCPEGEPNCND